MAYKCETCSKSKPDSEYMPSSSPFWPRGHIHICYDCVEELVDGNDLNQVDRLLQLSNTAFMPQEWRKLWKREGIKAFRKYATLYNDFNYYKYDWSDQNERLMEAAKKGVIDLELEELKPAFLKKLKTRWGDLPEYDLVWLETYYNNIMSDYNVQEETQRDMFRKICRMSLYIEKDLQNGGIDKDFMTQYNNFMTSALKNVQKKDSNAITSVGQIVEFIERNGYRANFYDGVPRDEIDMLLENMKEYIADLVRGETNLPEIYAQTKQRYDQGAIGGGADEGSIDEAKLEATLAEGAEDELSFEDDEELL